MRAGTKPRVKESCTLIKYIIYKPIFLIIYIMYRQLCFPAEKLYIRRRTQRKRERVSEREKQPVRLVN